MVNLKESDFDQGFNQNEFIPMALTSLVIDAWSNNKAQDVFRRNEVFKGLQGVGTAQFKNGHTFEGTLKSGKMNGEGKYTWKDGTVYEGSFIKNEINGKGKYIWKDGSTYEGEVRDGLRHGKGCYINARNNYKYDGEWKNGLRHGRGKLTYLPDPNDENAAVSYYEGGWKEGYKNGYGKFAYDTGNYYEGEWVMNYKSGEGTMHWFDFDRETEIEKYRGQWKDDFPDGFGTHIWLESKGENRVLRNRYVGYWKRGFREGLGMFFYSNGSMYIGEWKKNLKDGYGRFIYEDGNEFEGKFQSDRMMDRTLQGVVKTIRTLNSQLDSGKTISGTTEFDKNKKTSSPSSKTERIKLEGVRTEYFVTERVRAELEGNPFDNMIDISDLLLIEELGKIVQPSFFLDQAMTEKKDMQKEINKIMLRYRKELKAWYKYYSREVDYPNLEEGFVMVARQFWRFLYDCQVVSPGFSLAEFNRLYLKGKKTHFSLKYDPIAVRSVKENEKKNSPTKTNIEDKKDEDVKSAEGKKDINDNNSPGQENSKHDASIVFHEDLPSATEIQREADTISEDVHDPLRPMLFRHFAEAIVRAAALYYINGLEFANREDAGILKKTGIDLCDKLADFFETKLLPAQILMEEEEIPHNSLSIIYEQEIKEYDKSLYSVFKFHSNQSEQQMINTIDYTMSVKRFFSLAARTLECLNMKKIDLIGIIERNFDKADTANEILAKCSEEQKEEAFKEHVRGLLEKELIYYEYKEFILELALCNSSSAIPKAEAIVTFLQAWINLHRTKEIKQKPKPKRIWIETEKEKIAQGKIKHLEQKNDEIKKEEPLTLVGKEKVTSPKAVEIKKEEGSTLIKDSLVNKKVDSIKPITLKK